MVEVPAQGDEPRMRLFESLDELAGETGQNVSHGYFDATQNMIVATLDSCAHEVGHYRDWKSGRMAFIKPEDSALIRAQKRMRNEIVAILFAYQKVPSHPGLLDYEKNFLEWFLFTLKRNTFEKFSRPEICRRPFDQWMLSDIQDMAEWLVREDHGWFERLEFIFRHYNVDTHLTLTYGVRPQRKPN